MTDDPLDITYVYRDLRAGMTIEWSEPPDYLDVTPPPTLSVPPRKPSKRSA